MKQATVRFSLRPLAFEINRKIIEGIDNVTNTLFAC